ncbi:MAG: PAS domain S-box protein [Promethearchaeia archaeon]
MNKKVADSEIDIILVEDNPGDIRLVEELLKQARDFKFSFSSIQTLDKGLQKIKNFNFDIILLDLSLPDSRGVTTIRKTQEHANNTPIIVLTGLADEELARQAIQFGAQDYLVKGQIRSNRLVRSIYHAIDRKRMLKKIHDLASFPSDNPSPVLRVNKHKILYANPAAKSLFDIKDIKKGDNIPNVLKGYIKEAFNNNDIVNCEIERKQKDFSFILKPIKELDYINIYGMEITELKKAEKARRETQKQYSELFNHINDAVFIHDLEGNILDFNKKAMDTLGYSRKELIQLTVMDFDAPEFAKNVPRKIQEIKHKGQSIVETAHQTKEGKIIPIELNSKIINYEGKDAILSVARDITERKDYEKKIEKSEKRYRDLFDNSPYPIIIADLEGKILNFSVPLLRKSGYTRKDMINKSFNEIEFIPKEYSKYFNRIFQKLQEESKVKPLEVKCLPKKKDSLWLRLNFSLIDIENEKMVYILGQDITELKRSKRKLYKTERSLQELNTLIEDAPLAIVLLTPEGKILRMNREAIDLFECSHKREYEHNIFHFFPESELDKIISHYKENIYHPNRNKKFETYIKTLKGKKTEVEITSTIFKISDRIVIQSFISDISERKEHEKNRQKLLDQLLTSLEVKSRFFATISHELRTPLNAIIGFSDILLEESYGELNEDQKEFLEDVFSASNHLEELIGSVLDFSKSEAGKLKLNNKKFNIWETIKEVKTLVKPAYEKKGLEFIVQGMKKEDTIVADPLRFKQILDNLLTNAIKFTEQGYVKIKAIQHSDHWEFRIKDTGVGIKKENYDVVFREFGRVEDEIIKEISGSGIGLALTKRLVQLHGGEIWFESEYGKGTTFIFTIPKREGKFPKQKN